MPWYCDEIIAQASPGMLASLKAVPYFASRLYHLTVVEDYDGEVHRYPGDGLIFVRMVTTGDESFEFVWPEIPDVDSSEPVVLPPPNIWPPNIWREVPDQFLRCLRRLSRDHHAPVAYYAAASTGSVFDDDGETGWVFNPELTIYHFASKNPRTIEIHEAKLTRTESARIALVPMLLPFGIKLDFHHGFFTPHTRAFPWEQFRVPN